MSKSKRKKWYDNGLAFECTGCGNCCSGPEEGYVWVTKEEIGGLAKVLGVAEADFRRQFVRRVGIKYSLIEDPLSKDCVFLERDGQGGKKCLVYEARPMQCRTWPFWKSNVSTVRAWERAAEVCPGMDKGRWYGGEDICAILDGKKTADEPVEADGDDEHPALVWLRANLDNGRACEAVREVYYYLDQVVAAAGAECDNCGKCCDFDSYGHRLYVTTLEMLNFFRGVKGQKVKPVQGRCWYQNEDGCGAREFRPSGCRIFFCKGLDEAFQQDLTERALKQLRDLHTEFGSPYLYMDLRQWCERYFSSLT